MKILRKINKGFVLTLIVLIALIGYLVGVEKQRKAEKGNILEAMEKFIDVTEKYTVYRKITTEEDASKFEQEVKSELEKVMISNKESVEIQVQILLNNINIPNEEEKIESNRKIIKITSYEFEDNQVTVEFESNVENTFKYLDEQGKEQTRKDSYQTYSDAIILQKVDEEWKIVSSNLQFEDYKYYTEDVMVMY